MRKAAQVVKCARKFKSKIVLCHECKFADSCSIVDVLTLGAAAKAEVAVIANGPDEKEAVRTIVEIFSEGSGI